MSIGARILCVSSAMVLCAVGGYAQNSELLITLRAQGAITSTSKLFIQVPSPIPSPQTTTSEFNTVLSWGLEAQVENTDWNHFFSISVEYLKKVDEKMTPQGAPGNIFFIPEADGYRIIPVELGAYIYVPLGSESLKMAMGGGIGWYKGERLLERATVAAQTKGNPSGVGIHIGFHFRYMMNDVLGFTLGVKFRDPEIEVVNQFQQQSVVYQGRTVQLPREELQSRINVDGIALMGGIAITIH